MALEASVLECPNCGGSITLNSRMCDYCRTPIFIRRIQDISEKNPIEIDKYVRIYKEFLKNNTVESVETLNALGVCLLKRNTYDEAAKYFEKAINLIPENGDTFYYLALAMMKKKRPFLHTLSNIKKIVQYLQSALTYGTNGKYYYLLYLIQKDFYEKKHIRNGKNSEDLLRLAIENEVDDKEIYECKEYCALE